MGIRLPWWRLATLVLLIGALVLAIANGRTIEAVIIGVLLVPTLVVLGVWVYFWASPTQRRIALKYAQPMPEHDTYAALSSEIEAELQAQPPWRASNSVWKTYAVSPTRSRPKSCWSSR
jgi:hypothetical protein